MKWYRLLAGDLLWIASGFYLLTISWWLLPIALFIIGTGQHRMALLAHDAAHGHAGNDLAARLVYAPLLIGLDSYRNFHFMHHRYLGTGADPERFVKEFRPGKWDSIPDNLFASFVSDLADGVPNILNLVKVIWAHSPTKTDYFGVALFGLVWLALSLISWWILPVWMLSIVTVFWAVFRLRALHEHVPPIPCGNTLIFTPTKLEMLFVFGHKTWRHPEHHEDVSIPCWGLP